MNETGRTVVDLGARTYVCRAWQISGLPYKHAAAAMAYKRMNIELFYDEKFSKHAYLEAHGGMIHPIVDSKLWPPAHGDPLDPPPPYRRLGRPKKNKRRDADEPATGTSQVRRSMTIRCMICKAFGHNKRTCPKNANKVQKGSSSKATNASGPEESSSTSQRVRKGGLSQPLGASSSQPQLGRGTTQMAVRGGRGGISNSQPPGATWSFGASSSQPQLGRGTTQMAVRGGRGASMSQPQLGSGTSSDMVNYSVM
ncbi:uncharacterized protein LOC132306663 isoform X3 [Cornus florida]|uniref:uncharacterized protein LOC132306663 isoform X3 n=1 Tax=Cornus florida TaxID=4283 RepID=UPI00289C2138|nr:uncharacterized protein LOC132306663 isoform X3 [Cornus florida]